MEANSYTWVDFGKKKDGGGGGYSGAYWYMRSTHSACNHPFSEIVSGRMVLFCVIMAVPVRARVQDGCLAVWPWTLSAQTHTLGVWECMSVREFVICMNILPSSKMATVRWILCVFRVCKVAVGVGMINAACGLRT